MAGRTLVSRFSPFVAAAIRTPTLLRLRPLIAAGDGVLRRFPAASVSVGALRSYSSRPTTSSLNDPSPNWSNRPPKETILLDGCDFEHWLVVMEPPDPSLTRDDIIDSYIKTLSQVVGSEQEARMSIYSVSTKHYFAFGAKVSEELSYKIKALPKVRWVLPDSYLDVKNKDYGGVLPKYFNSEWSVAQFRLHEGSQYIVAFGHRKNTIVILGMDGRSLQPNAKPNQKQKVKCLIHYFKRISLCMPTGSVSFERKVLPFEPCSGDVSYPEADFWRNSTTALCPFEVFSSGLIEDQKHDALEVDFADEYLGGGTLRRGCVQRVRRRVDHFSRSRRLANSK